MRLQIIRHELLTSRRGGHGVVLISKTDGPSGHLRFCAACTARTSPIYLSLIVELSLKAAP